MSRRLRVGLLLDGWNQPAWVRRVVEDVVGSGIAEVALVVLNGDPPGGDTLAARLRRKHPWLLYQAYVRADRAFFRPTPDAFAGQDLRPLVPGVPTLSVRPRKQGFSDWFEDEDVERILEADLDVALRFGFRIMRGRSLAIARHGVWSYHHGDNRVNRGAPPGFWEVMEGTDLTGSVLQVLTEELDGGRVIYRSQASTHQESVTRNLNNYYWKSAGFVLRCLERLHETGRVAPEDEGRGDAPSIYSHRLYRQPRNAEMAGLVARHAARVARKAATRAVFREQWTLAYAFAPEIPPLYRFRYIEPPPDRYWADPFPVAADGRYYLFCEEYIEGKGRIAVIELERDGTWRGPQTVLDRPYHLSYPFIFEWGGERYMIPETVANRTVELYRCVSFPDRWEHVQNLMEGIRAVDATLLEHGGRWWLFAGVGPPGILSWDELHVFHAASPLGPWTPHRTNPVTSDIRNARPGGCFFRRGGSLFRPAQDGSRHYGYALNVNRVDRLDEEGYAETPVARIVPEWDRGLTSVHTLNRVDDLTVVDCVRRRPRRPLTRGG
jgi:hypothetical protein